MITDLDKEQLKLEIEHIFDSGANEIRVYEMVLNFIDRRDQQKLNIHGVMQAEGSDGCEGAAVGNSAAGQSGSSGFTCKTCRSYNYSGASCRTCGSYNH